MVLIKNLLGILKVKVINRFLTPRKIQHELDIIVLDAVIRRRGVISFKLVHLLFEDGLNLRRPLLFLSTGSELRKLFHIVHSKLFLDGLELIVKEILSLLLIYFSLYLLVDFLLDLLKLDLSVEYRKKLHRTGEKIAVLKQVDLVHKVINLYGCSDKVHKELKAVNGFESIDRIARNKRRSTDNRCGLLLERLSNHSCLGIILGSMILKITYSTQHIWDVFNDICYLETGITLKDGSNCTIRHFYGLDDLRYCTIAEKVVLTRILD